MEVLSDDEGNVGILLDRDEALMLAAMQGSTSSNQRYKLVQEAKPYFERKGVIFPDDLVVKFISNETMFEMFSLLDDVLTKNETIL